MGVVVVVCEVGVVLPVLVLVWFVVVFEEGVSLLGFSPSTRRREIAGVSLCTFDVYVMPQLPLRDIVNVQNTYRQIRAWSLARQEWPALYREREWWIVVAAVYYWSAARRWDLTDCDPV